jgi:hypothetical protein
MLYAAKYYFVCIQIFLFHIISIFLFLAAIWNMSSNGSNDTQLGRLDSLFGSQGSSRNFTSLLNPSYLQSPNGKESHKRETDGKHSVVNVIYLDRKLCLITMPPPSTLSATRLLTTFFFLPYHWSWSMCANLNTSIFQIRTCLFFRNYCMFFSGLGHNACVIKCRYTYFVVEGTVGLMSFFLQMCPNCTLI